MNLEDHLGDIIRKARAAANISAAVAARAAGITVSQLQSLEQSGVTDARPNLASLARQVGLSASKLEGIAQGWLPEPRDLRRWRELRQVITEQGGNSVNSFVIWDEASREAALFDTGWDAAPIFQLIEENQARLTHLFLTHSHQDHIAAMEPLRRRFPKLLLHAGAQTTPVPGHGQDDDGLRLGRLRISHREVPGHAEDGMIYLISGWPGDVPGVAVIGDTLFAGSLARGFISVDVLKQKVREHIFTLPPDTLLCPGHGPVTTVAEELAHNPFFD